MQKVRIEHDSLGEVKVPNNAYFGVHTQRAVENFPISGLKVDRDLIRSLAMLKLAACRVHRSLRLLDHKKARAIEQAAKEVVLGRFDDQFPVDAFQAGAGTSTHMNVNEVIANRAIELLGGKKGDYKIVHPNDDVNKGQSTNDVFPNAIRVSVLFLMDPLRVALVQLSRGLRRKAGEFGQILKSGRTHLQDAVPIRLGQEIGAWALTLERQAIGLDEAVKRLKRMNLGGTAVGTGVNTHPKYSYRVIRELSEIMNMPLERATDLIEPTQSMADFVFLSAVLRGLAVELTRIANDVRLLSSGPMTGLRELVLPAVQAGSSIMPGKVNPSVVEMLNMVCFQVMGHDRAIELAGQAGQMELNVMMPLIGHDLMGSMKILTRAMTIFEEKCVRGMQANEDVCRFYFEAGLGLATLLNPVIGYEKAAKVAQQAYREKKTIPQVIRELGILTEDRLKKLLDPKKLTSPTLSS